jgi:hypothetical protein
MKLLLSIALSLFPAFVFGQIITTVAGTGISGYSGDGGSATDAQLNNPLSMTFDKAGNLFVVDFDNNRIRKISTSGIINTIAGTGVAGSDGDNGPATAAKISANSIAVDTSGNIYFAEQNHKVRKIDAAGIVTTIAGNGLNGYNGDSIPATNASLSYPYLGAVDGLGNVYFADFGNQRIRKVSTSGIITTIAGTGTPGTAGDGGPATAAALNGPIFLYLSPTGTIYIPANGANKVRKINSADIISTVAGSGVLGNTGDGGSATSATLDVPNSVALDDSGNLYITCTGANVIRKIDNAGAISTVVGTTIASYGGDGGPAITAGLNAPVQITVNNGNLYIADAGNNRIRRVKYNTTAVTDITNAGGISLYPNPVIDELMITAAATINTITITNMLGQTVLSKVCNSAIWLRVCTW